MFLGEGHLPVILQVKPLNATPDQVLPARLHGRTQLTGVQRRDLTWTGGRPDVSGLLSCFRCFACYGAVEQHPPWWNVFWARQEFDQLRAHCVKLVPALIMKNCLENGYVLKQSDPTWSTLIIWHVNSRTCPSSPTLQVLSRGEALVRGHHRSLFYGDSSRHTDETRLEICMFGKSMG